MSAYQTVVVGTDGSDSSFRAVERAAAIAADAGATLVIASAYQPRAGREVERAQDALGADVGYQVVGSTPAEESVRTAAERARRVGATKVDTVVVAGDPVPALAEVVAERGADLLVIGNRGLNTLAGRILGSVPAEAARKSTVDVLIVHTT
ncbi:universal stress protein [Actinokineospora diospyrosa]|uniref:Nucleotide-binding universal stress protein, UspA family n=1 Tax=Actinokineospora diospyrosa TaxID=103728 RepID=A0ABT1IB89_9PSEU|nr:universal stress protein [Actinokineospora diospyrosa]MCP2269907.1 Nucleotide-binding universal stress protein, UspA family [Actinokineospora diospyrosa]